MAITTDPRTALRLADKALSRLHPARDEAQFVAACHRRTDAMAQMLGTGPRSKRPQTRRRTADAPTPTDTGNGRVVVLHGRVQRVTPGGRLHPQRAHAGTPLMW